jgi:hypothetical protein
MRFLLALTLLLVGSLAPKLAAAGVIEVSAGVAYNRSNYSAENYSWNRRWGLSLGYYLSERSEIELSFQDVIDRTVVTNYEDTTFHDRIYSLNWVQALTGKNAAVQPYLKVGVGQLNREATGFYGSVELGTASPPPLVDAVTGVVGAGMRVYFTRKVGVRTEATSYLAGGSIGTWKDNYAITVGFFIYL